MSLFERRITRNEDGELQLLLPEEERALLRSLPDQLRTLLDEPDDPSLRRLFPPAYPDDSAHEAEYRQLMGADLRDRHLRALALMEETVDAGHLTEDQAAGWLSALNDLRLFLGTQLDVTEDTMEEDVDPSDPRAPALALYDYLTWLEGQLVDALATAL